MKKYGVHLLIILLSLIPIMLNEGFETILFINNVYRLVFAIGLFYLGAVIYRFFVGKIVAFGLLLLLTLNFSLSLIARMVYNTNFDETQATSILLTNSSEGLGMLKGYISYIILSILYFFVSVYLLLVLVRRNREGTMAKKYLVFVAVNLILYSVLALDSFVVKGDKKKFNKSSNTTKFLQKMAFYNSARFQTAVNFMEETKKILDTKVDYSDVQTEDNNIKNIVVIIGESARKDAFSLYGNPLETSPNIVKRINNLMIYENAVAPASYTILSVPMMLSKAIPSDDYSALEVSDNVVNLANYTGIWNTYWFSSHEKIGIHVNAISAFADFAKTREWNSDKYDQYLVPMVRQAVSDTARKRLIFVHTIGSHYPLTDRYPKEFDVFKQDKKQYVNEYYNSIHYTDYVIEQIIKEIEVTPSVLIYVSDHAQTDNKTMFTHSLTKKGLDVPFFIWHSNSVEEKYKIRTPVKTSVSTTELYEVIKKYMGIKTDGRKQKNTDLKVLSGDMKMYYYKDLKEE